jgi:D-lactate dehydrogenase (cytochrome)
VTRPSDRSLIAVEADGVTEISKKEGEALGIFASIVGHLGDGNFHEAIMVNKKDPIELSKVEKAVHNMIDRALEMEGTCTVSSPL